MTISFRPRCEVFSLSASAASLAPRVTSEMLITRELDRRNRLFPFVVASRRYRRPSTAPCLPPPYGESNALRSFGASGLNRLRERIDVRLVVRLVLAWVEPAQGPRGCRCLSSRHGQMLDSSSDKAGLPAHSCRAPGGCTGCPIPMMISQRVRRCLIHASSEGWTGATRSRHGSGCLLR
jgi:hypothetical protein